MTGTSQSSEARTKIRPFASPKERVQLGFSNWNEAETAAKNRATCKKKIDSPILHQERRIDDDETNININKLKDVTFRIWSLSIQN